MALWTLSNCGNEPTPDSNLLATPSCRSADGDDATPAADCDWHAAAGGVDVGRVTNSRLARSVKLPVAACAAPEEDAERWDGLS